MSFVPTLVNPEYAEIKTRIDHSHIKALKFPKDVHKIGRLTLEQKMVWYAAQDPQELITMYSGIEGQISFAKFWFWRYILPLRLKRFWYSFKFW